jgi:hypothetical protein
MTNYYKKIKKIGHVKFLFWGIGIILLLVALSFCIGCQAREKERLEKLCIINKFNQYNSFSISPSGDYILMQGPSDETIAQTPEGTEFNPGGVKRLYDKRGARIWEKKFAGYLDFCANEVYLMEPSSAEFEGPYPPTIYYRKDGSLFFRMPKKIPEVNSFDVNPRGDMILVGEMFSDRIMLIHKGKEVWDYGTGSGKFIDVVFSKDGTFFMESQTNSLFSVDDRGVVNKIKASVVRKTLNSFNYRDLKDTIHFVFPRGNGIFEYRPNENKLFSLDLSSVEEAKRKLVVKELSTKYNLQPKEIIFSKFLDHVGVVTDDAFHYFAMREQ